jgi:hypothetical protein
MDKKKKLKWKEETLARSLEIEKQYKIKENLSNLNSYVKKNFKKGSLERRRGSSSDRGVHLNAFRKKSSEPLRSSNLIVGKRQSSRAVDCGTDEEDSYYARQAKHKRSRSHHQPNQPSRGQHS